MVGFDRQQLIGLKYYEQLLERIPRAEVEAIERLIREQALKLNPKLTVTTCGSYRRYGKFRIKTFSFNIDIYGLFL